MNGGNNVRVSAFRAALVAMLVAVAGRAAADEPAFKFEFHGFAGSSLYAQDFIGNNQGGFV